MSKLLSFKYFPLYLLLSVIFLYAVIIGYYGIFYSLGGKDNFQGEFLGCVILNMMILVPVSYWYKNSPEAEELKIYFLKPGSISLINIGLLIISITLIGIVDNLVIDLFDYKDTENILWTVNNITSLPDLIIWIIVCVSATAICEEYLFRGLAYKVLRKKYKFIPSVTLTSIFFLLFHPIPEGILAYVFFNIVACYIYERTDSLIYPIIIHFVLNALMYIFVYLSPQSYL